MRNTLCFYVLIIKKNSRHVSCLSLPYDYVATLYEDGKDADFEKNPTSYQIKKGIVTAKTRISAKLARSGGFALSLIEATPADRKIIKKWK